MPVASVGSMSERTGHRNLWATAGAATVLVCMTACTPEPAPTPSPTGFTSEAEAFAAAEQTFRDYIDASNGVVLSDPGTFERLFALSTGDQNAFDRKRLSNYHADGYVSTGETIIVATADQAWDPASGMTTLGVCLDVSDVDIKNSSGESIVSVDRPDRQTLSVILDSTDRQFLVASISGDVKDDQCAP